MNTTEQILKELNEMIYSYNRGFKGSPIEHMITSEMQEYLNNHFKASLQRVREETIEEILLDTKDYQIPAGYGSASGSLTKQALQSYLIEKLTKLKESK